MKPTKPLFQILMSGKKNTITKSKIHEKLTHFFAAVFARFN